MQKKIITRIAFWVLAAIVALALLQVAQAAGNIDATNKWAWGTNVGWINFNPTDGGVTYCFRHLEGYAWAENIGWIRLGSSTGCAARTYPYYSNTSKDDYGVNADASGNLSGYAWGTNVGWINFSPTNGGVTINQTTGSFDGYAWGENIGWIHFKNASPAYNVVTTSPTAVTLSSFTAQVEETINGWIIAVLAIVGICGAWFIGSIRRVRGSRRD